MQQFCKLVVDDPEPAKLASKANNDFHSAHVETFDKLSVEQLIEFDKPYGRVDSDVVKYSIINKPAYWSRVDTLYAINIALTMFDVRLKKDFEYVPDPALADWIIDFRKMEDDPNLDENTLAYAYYPVAPENVRGLLVFNRRFPWTRDGREILGHELLQMGFEVEFLNNMYVTYDMDWVARHEFGHKLGLPHDPDTGELMSPSYSRGTAFISERMELRLWATSKYEKIGWLESKLRRIISILRRRSDSY